jgi:hypothetical protein
LPTRTVRRQFALDAPLLLGEGRGPCPARTFDKPSRERLTLIRIFEELRGLGYEGGYDTVRRYARAWSRSRGAMTAEAYVPLHYASGEA